MMKEIEYVIQALKKVDTEYYNVIGFNEEDEKYQQSAENAFTAELYHQLKCFQNEFYNNKSLHWHFDLNKERANGKRPDLVFHHSPDDRNDQRIFIEVKTNSVTPNCSIDKDINKIIEAVSDDDGEEKLGFTIAIYIAGNIPLDKLKDRFNDKLNNIPEHLIDKMRLIHFTSGNYNPEVHEIKKLITQP